MIKKPRLERADSSADAVFSAAEIESLAERLAATPHREAPAGKRTAEQLEREFEEIVPELSRAIGALIRGYLPRELRSEPFSVGIEVTRLPGPKAASRRERLKKPPASATKGR